jgi:hypothetical protein
MIIEHQILAIQRRKLPIRESSELKQKGYKTEPAFGHLLGLKNDPYRRIARLIKLYSPT